jgi:predicted ribosomally synthesized peptide with SipW-like signal peptide
MKKTIKTLLIVLCAIMLVAASVAGTVAYLTSSQSVTNTFSAGQVNITLEETKVDEYGVALTGNAAGTTDEGQDYKLLPGREYVKDPVITVAQGSEPCWLFIKVENGIEAYEADTNTIADQLTANGWTLVEPNVYYHAVVDARTSEQKVDVFGTFEIAENANTVAGWSSVTSANTKVIVTAYAIQADGFNDTDKTEEQNAASAWAALNP